MKCGKHEVAEDDECAQCELDLCVANTRSDAKFLMSLAEEISGVGEAADEENDSAHAEALDHVVVRLHAIATELEAIADDDESHPPLPPQAHDQVTRFVQ